MATIERDTAVRPARIVEPAAGRERARRSFCAVPPVPPRVLGPDIAPARARAILVNQNRWVNGTVLHYYFYDGENDGSELELPGGAREWRGWVGAEAQKEVVREAFARWKGLGIGLEFQEVDARGEAEVRIGFQQGDGSWSYIGRYVLEIGAGERTMNFGWDLVQDPDTALHEIGHTLGMAHEHQNPHAGIVWNEAAVYASLGGDPNFWDRETIEYNILRKLHPGEVRGSTWDPDSVMHYPFDPGLIQEPETYREGLVPAGGLSERDVAWARAFYPARDQAEMPPLRAGRSEPLAIANGQQCDFAVRPDATREYNLRTFGSCDTVMVLFEDVDGELRYRAGDDDSGEDRNASLAVKLFKGRAYVLRVRLNYSDASSPPTVMMW